MKVLLDTHLLLWAAAAPQKLSKAALEIIEDPKVELFFSAASIWEIAIKRSLSRADFRIDPRLFWRALIENGYVETPITSAHAVAIDLLPPLHKDPFDRMLIAQAIAEPIALITGDRIVAQYPGPIQYV